MNQMACGSHQAASHEYPLIGPCAGDRLGCRGERKKVETRPKTRPEPTTGPLAEAGGLTVLPVRRRQRSGVGLHVSLLEQHHAGGRDGGRWEFPLARELADAIRRATNHLAGLVAHSGCRTISSTPRFHCGKRKMAPLAAPGHLADSSGVLPRHGYR